MRNCRPAASALVLALTLAFGFSAPPAIAADGGGKLTRAEYEACQTRDDDQFRQAVESVTNAALKRSLSGFNYAGAVTDAWRSGEMDAVIDTQVDKAVADVGKETSWGELLQSLADSAKSQALATAVAERVYRSEPVKAGIEAVATDVGRTLGISLEFATEDSAEPATNCLRAFLGPRYGATVAQAVTANAEKEFGVGADTGRAKVGTGAVLSQSSDGITGAALILMRRQLASLAGRVGQRIVGSVLARLVSVAAGGVGAVLVAKDIWELRSGVLPIIATEMKAQSAKDLIRAELAKSIADQIGEHLKELSAKSAGRIIEIWQEFRRAHAKSLELADRDAEFRRLLDRTAPPQLPRLDEVVGLLLATEGEGAILKRLADGTLDTAVNTLPADGMAIARETRSLASGLEWAAVAGDLLPKVVLNELHKRSQPGAFTRASLAQLLALDDRIAIARLGSLTREARAALFELAPANLKPLARTLPEAELAGLAGYLAALDAQPRARIATAIAADPRRMKALASDRVREAVLASRDQVAAVDMMLRDGNATLADVVADFKAAYDGRVAAWLLIERHPGPVALSVVPILVIVLLVWRVLFSRRRPKPPVAAAP